MLGAIRGAFSFLRQKQILHKLGVLLSISIIAAACYMLYHKLQNVDFDAVVAAMTQTEPRQIALSALFVAAAYFTLTFYDWFAVRAVGRSGLPYRVTALAAFTSYSIGHNVGASVFTGGAVRYRIYSGWGLDAIDVAKVCFIAGLTFWLGNVAVLGMGMAYHPEAASNINHLPTWVNQALAFVMLAGLAGYVIWVAVKEREVGRGNWTVFLPGGKLTLLQIGIGIVDLGFCSLAMYMLVPGEPNLGFIVVAVVFVSATLLGFASHSPGGLGVFDAAMMMGLYQMNQEELLAGMLLFRILYYLTPFLLSIILLTCRELIMAVQSQRFDSLPHSATAKANPDMKYPKRPGGAEV